MIQASTNTVLVTGAAGFIGSHLCRSLLTDKQQAHRVVGVDSFDTFYDPALKRRNIGDLLEHECFELMEADVRERQAMQDLFAGKRPDVVVHLAARAGVRPSIEDPALYTSVNVDGTVNLLEAAVAHDVKRFIFASSSSVYGNNKKVPFAEDDPVDYPISPYAATKRAGELLCHTYSHLHRLPIACLRFFTVYGPAQRPDLAIRRFMECIAAGEPITMFGDGSTSRDYTYIDDIISGIRAAIDRIEGFRIYNLGNSTPTTLAEMIAAIERVVGRQAIIERKPMQAGDVERTFADLTRSRAELGYQPATSFEQGLQRQWEWLQNKAKAAVPASAARH